ncbi:MAG: spermidine synthase [Gammaproteobacteria bacterium]
MIAQPERDLRFLTSDASVIGAAGIRTGENRLSYQRFVELAPSVRPGTKKTLLIGLGAGHMVRTLRDRFGRATDTLEIDPVVSKAAIDYFDFKPNGEAIVRNTRYEIRRLKGPYDLVILDCFTGGSEPSHLLTVESLLQLRGLMSKSGLLMVNFVAFSG